MRHLVSKFGGTSVSTLENWEHIAFIVKQHIDSGIQPIIVCSALTKASDQLEKMVEAALINEHALLQKELAHNYIQLAKALGVNPEIIASDLQQLEQWLMGIALLREAPDKTRAQVLSLGEIMMTRLGNVFLNKKGIVCQWFDVRQALCATPILGGDSVNYLSAHCNSNKNSTLIHDFWHSGAKAIITQGFIASNCNGDTVLLGRGGSDTSAALLAVMVNAEKCEIWTDVPGIYTANPHQLPHARLLKQLNYDEAQEIASMGAKVLHPNCLPPVKKPVFQ